MTSAAASADSHGQHKMANGKALSVGTLSQGTSLIQAARDDDLKSVKTLVKAAADCKRSGGLCKCVCFHARDGTSGHDCTALMAAAKAGHADVIQLLLQSAKVNVRARESASGRTALAMAAAEGHDAVVAALLGASKAIVGLRDSHGKTPLMLAAEGGHSGVVKLLIAAKAEMTYRNPLDGETALTLAAEGGHEDVVRLLLEAHADGNVACVADGLTPLMKAARKGHRHVVRVLLGVGKVDVNARRASAGKCAKEKNPVEVLGGGGETSLMFAVSRKHIDVVETLLGHAADVSIKAEDGSTDALTLALQLDDWAIAKMLVETGRADVNGALLWGVRNRSYPAVCWMVRLGADVNKAGVSGWSFSPVRHNPLAVAAQAGARDIISLLVTEGADIHLPLVALADAGHLEALKLLYAEGADLEEATDWGFQDVALVAAARRGYKHVVEYLLSVGANVNGRNKLDRQTPLMVAAAKGKQDVARLLIQWGADVNAEDSKQQTALMLAAIYGHEQAALVLLENRAYIEAKDRQDGQTALPRAREKKKKVVEDLLLSRGARQA